MSDGCSLQHDANMPCYVAEGETAVEASDVDGIVCIGCRRSVVEITSTMSSQERNARRIGLKLSVTGTNDQVILDGQDITNLCNGINISARPGELLSVQLSMLLNRKRAVEIPEALMEVSVLDMGRAINLEMALVDLLAAVQAHIDNNAPEDVDESLREAARQAAVVTIRDSDVTETVRDRLKRLIW